jgi:hypothetical protein
MLFSHDEPRHESVAFSVNGNGFNTDAESLADESSIPAHPLGIKPLGNKYFWDGATAVESAGTLQILPDEMLVQILEFLDGRSLRMLGSTCKFLFAHCISEELWKSLFLA